MAAVLALRASAFAQSGTPDAWAQDAVNFAAEQGMMDAGDARPHDPATRAELAAMVTRLFDAREEADLSGFADVPQTAWYYECMAKAVAMGVYEGGGSALDPEGRLTREQAMTVLGRTFGVCGETDEALSSFDDAEQVGFWARKTVAAMVDAGYVHGIGNRLKPCDLITRQELAYLLYSMSGAISSGGEIPEEGGVLLLAGDAVPDHTTVNGDLVLGCDYEGPLELRGVTVHGRLVIHGGMQVTLSGGSTAERIVCCGPGVRLETGGKGTLAVLNGDAAVTGGLDTLLASGDVTVESGTVGSATVSGTALTVQAEASVDSATLNARQGIVQGEGTVREALVLKKDCQILTGGTQVTDRIDAGIDQVQIKAVKAANDARPASPQISTTVQFGNVDVTNCAGAEEGVRRCTLTWYVDGALAQEQQNFALTEGATAGFSTTASYAGKPRAGKTLMVRLQYEDETVSMSQTVSTHADLLLSNIQTIQVEATALRSTSLYSGMNLTGWTGTMKQGTTGIYVNYNGTTSGKVVLPDGTSGWVRWSDLRISAKDYVQDTDYSVEQKENFVNVKGYSSASSYLVWVSLKTQKVNIFAGSQGKWKLAHAYSCCSGKNSTPTIAGVFQYQYRNDSWDFGAYYVKQVMVFNGGHAFHTRTYVKTTGQLLDATIGKPASHGCIRMYDADVNWMAANLPFRTTVVVY